MSYADSSDPMPPGPDFLANPPLQQRDQPQGPPLYGAHPQLGGPKRPGPATAAAVLGIISGSLGLFPAIIVLLATAKVYETENAVRSTNIAFIILLILALATAFAVITLLVAGITFLTGRGYTVLLSAVITQLTLTVLYAVIMLLALDSIFQNMRNRGSGDHHVLHTDRPGAGCEQSRPVAQTRNQTVGEAHFPAPPPCPPRRLSFPPCLIAV